MEAGRVAVITGGASGIGLAVARKCASLGMLVVIADVDAKALDTAKQALQNLGGPVVAHVCDVTSYESVQTLRDSVYRDHGEVGFLFLNAGLSVGSSAYKTPMSDWHLQLNVNLFGVVHGVQLFTPLMIKQGTKAHIVATSSYAGLINTSTLGMGAGTPYTVSKHAVTLSMEALSHQLRSEKGCQVSSHILCPGAVSTNYMKTSLNLNMGDEKVAAKMMEKVEKNMVGAATPEAIAQILLEGLRDGRFYILGFDMGQPKEMLRTMLQMRADDIIGEDQPLTHLIRDDQGKGKRDAIKKATAEGAEVLQRQRAIQALEERYWNGVPRSKL